MSRYILSAPALRDLEQIDDYVSADNPVAADRLLDSFRAAFDLLAAMPAAGRRRDEIGQGVRSFVVGMYVIFYRVVGGSVEIVRVLHGRRDIGGAFEE